MFLNNKYKIIMSIQQDRQMANSGLCETTRLFVSKPAFLTLPQEIETLRWLCKKNNNIIENVRNLIKNSVIHF